MLVQSSKEAQHHRLVEELQVAEYKSVRDEWLASRDAQQQTLQWTFAASALLLAGILNSGVRSHEPFLYVALAGATAALATFSQAVWFGEVVRMERAALFLRGLEASFRHLQGGNEGLPPLSWETWRSVKPTSGKSPWISSASVSIVGGFALYSLLTIAAVVVLLSVSFDDQIPNGDRHFATAIAIVAALIYVGANVYMCSKALYIYGNLDQGAQLANTSPGVKKEAIEHQA